MQQRCGHVQRDAASLQSSPPEGSGRIRTRSQSLQESARRPVRRSQPQGAHKSGCFFPCCRASDRCAGAVRGCTSSSPTHEGGGNAADTHAFARAFARAASACDAASTSPRNAASTSPRNAASTSPRNAASTSPRAAAAQARAAAITSHSADEQAVLSHRRGRGEGGEAKEASILGLGARADRQGAAAAVGTGHHGTGHHGRRGWRRPRREL